MLLFFLFLCIQVHSENLCPTGTQLSSKGDVCFSPLSVDTFYGAELSCLQLGGGHLPSVDSLTVNNDLIKMGNTYFPGCDSIWLGLDARNKWINGDPSTFCNFDNNITNIPTGMCGIIPLNTDGKWQLQSCNTTRGFICAFPVQNLTDVPMNTCSISKPTGPLITTHDVWCTVKNQRCPNWNVAVIVGLKQTNANINNKITAIQNYISEIVGQCSSASNILLITPGTYQTNSACNEENATYDGIHTLFDNLSAGQAKFRTTDNETAEIIGMFNALTQCSTFNLNSTYAGMLLFLTDVYCDDVCNDLMLTNQQGLIDNMTFNNYNLRFIRLGDDPYEKDCFTKVFSRCADYSPLICKLSAYNSTNEAENDVNQQFCKSSSSSKSIPTVWIIVSSITALLIIIACVGIRCFFRYKALKQGTKWSWFVWRSPENENLPSVAGGKVLASPNEYGELHREADLWEIVPENLTLNESDVLGSGAFATVFLGSLKGEIPLTKMNNGGLKLGIRKDADGYYKVAVKRLPPHATLEGRIDFNHEIEFMKNLGYHPHVLSLLGVVNSTHDAMIVIENCENGDLLTFVRNRKETFLLTEPEGVDFGPVLRVKDLMSISWQISDGMSYLASKNFIHRDIAARNILLTRSMVAKISDFGLCRLVDSSLYTAKGGRLPIKWMSPESLRYYEYSLKSDVWSFGVLLFELFSLGEAPYGTIQPSDMPKYLEQGNRLSQPDTCPNEIYQIMSKTWRLKPDDRPDIDEIREELTVLLNSDSSSYGYLSVKDLFDTEICEI